MKPFYEVGRYEVEATSQGFTKTGTGNTQFVLKFTVKGKVDTANPDKLFAVPAQYERTHYRVITDKTVEYFMKDLETLGVQISSFSDLDPDNPNHTSLKGKVFDAFCTHEKNNDGERERWGIARTSESKPVESIASSEVKSLDRLFGKHLKKAANTAPAQRAQQPQPVAPGGLGVTDDDIPF